ncbi:RagB/SusD family nutrient uptake outer membrane protein [Flavobacterium sp. ST-87]|uniref:RagB/SusD family nutrient uptake outer membrane protein n=1 Tax=Flavobacterium plantiphilum TaxID=3163297 RepID=A0ABW8XU09_9FLAO
MNIVRSRATMPSFPLGMTRDDFRTKLRNERRVELAFEEHRFWDVRRWKIGEETKDIYKMNVQQTQTGFSFTKELLTTRPFDQKMYLYPIPFTETVINPNLTQNPDW